MTTRERLHGCAAVALALLLARCGGGSDGGPLGPAAPVTLAEVQSQVFSPRCAVSGCHTGTTPPFGLNLSAGQAAGNLVGVPSAEIPSLLRVEPFDAANSYLFMKVTADPGINGDPMPASGPALNAADIALIEAWIDQGAL